MKVRVRLRALFRERSKIPPLLRTGPHPPQTPRRQGDELFGLTLARFACYAYDMDKTHHGPHSLNPPADLLDHRATGFRAESFFDGTKLPKVVGDSQNHN